MDNISITMSLSDWNKLTCYILMNSTHRKEELEAAISLSKVTNENGEKEFPQMEDYARYVAEQNAEIERIKAFIDESVVTPKIEQERLISLVEMFKDRLIAIDEEQAYKCFDNCGIDAFEGIRLGLDAFKWEEYNGKSMY